MGVAGGGRRAVGGSRGGGSGSEELASRGTTAGTDSEGGLAGGPVPADLQKFIVPEGRKDRMPRRPSSRGSRPPSAGQKPWLPLRRRARPSLASVSGFCPPRRVINIRFWRRLAEGRPSWPPRGLGQQRQQRQRRQRRRRRAQQAVAPAQHPVQVQPQPLRARALSLGLARGAGEPRRRRPGRRAAAVSAFLAWIRSPCLRHCVHGAPTNTGGRARAAREAAAGGAEGGRHPGAECGGTTRRHRWRRGSR
jgi:hypothetical protein